MLSGLADLKLPVLDDAVALWKEKGRTDRVFSFSRGGETWWAGFGAQEYTRGDQNRLWAGVLIPESDYLAEIANQRNLALSVILGVGVLVAIAIMVTSLRRIRQQLRQAVSRIESELGQYRLQQKIGDGGNGAVYRARHALLRRPTAIKTWTIWSASRDPWRPPACCISWIRCAAPWPRPTARGSFTGT